MSRYFGSLDMYRCISEVRKIKAEGYSLKTIVCMIGDAYKKHDRNEKLTQLERVVLGLRYSEFLMDENLTSDSDYMLAETKRQELLKVLGIKSEELRQLCIEICGLH